MLVETNGRLFSPTRIFNQALQNFKKAVLAYGESLKVFRTTRRHTNRKKHVPEKTLNQFNSLIRIEPGTYEYRLTHEFNTALTNAETAVATLTTAHS